MHKLYVYVFQTKYNGTNMLFFFTQNVFGCYAIFSVITISTEHETVNNSFRKLGNTVIICICRHNWSTFQIKSKNSLDFYYLQMTAQHFFGPRVANNKTRNIRVWFAELNSSRRQVK